MSKSTDWTNNWSVFSKERNTLYGISILSIIIFHYFEDINASDFSGGLCSIGAVYLRIIGSVGVELFIFLSGISLFFSMKKDEKVKQFYKKRIKRIIPTYLTIAIPFWGLVDIIFRPGNVKLFFEDLFFVTFFLNGTRTFWYVLFILIAYMIYPLLYKRLNSDKNLNRQIVMLILGGLLIQFFPRKIMPSLYSNIEILLGRFLIFFIGCWCGTKVYRESTFNKLERVGFNFGLLLMLGTFIPNIQDIIQKFGDRILMCFWGLFLVYILAIIIEKAPPKMKSFLNYLGMMSYELYLTHVAIRAFMNFVGMNTYHIINYILCISVSVILSVWIKKLQGRIAYVNEYLKR